MTADGRYIICHKQIKFMNMTRELTLRSRIDDLNISVLVVSPEDKPKAVIQLAHGVCGCKERFIPMMEYMASRGVACIAGDHRGHGRSVRSVSDLGYMYKDGYMALVDDMRVITQWIHSTFPAIPVYLVGHSMGSMAARVYTKYDDSQIDGLVLTGSPSWVSFFINTSTVLSPSFCNLPGLIVSFIFFISFSLSDTKLLLFFNSVFKCAQ